MVALQCGRTVFVGVAPRISRYGFCKPLWLFFGSVVGFHFCEYMCRSYVTIINTIYSFSVSVSTLASRLV